ncbi:hypothetical protein SAMN05216548_106102 [Faunimonas pinastri]|uniref:Uncharacterized protein n=1 Tax=Faunimonas pinastri TaxID=1855383 RepID=A0A1H9HNG6_9HYPH|nr:hypothetical protein [Faunimonas pinastri]SEQ63874.1 hypothetical protein SAMN05216548_106102 [Faunimonas pinastri]
MADNVVALHGEFQAQESEIDQRLVSELERLLEAAKSGEITGLVAATLNKDKVASYAYAGLVGSYGMIGALECAKGRLLRITA